jgi:hypothetical protein
MFFTGIRMVLWTLRVKASFVPILTADPARFDIKKWERRFAESGAKSRIHPYRG